MAAIARLADLPIGSTALLPVRLTAKGAGGATVETLARGPAGWTVTGSFTIAMPSLAVSGAWTSDPRDQPVRVLAVAMSLGDVMRKDATGEVLVVQAVDLGPDRDRWSSATSGQPSYTGEGWSRIGHVDIT